MKTKLEKMLRENGIMIPKYLFSSRNRDLEKIIPKICEDSSDAYVSILLKGRSGSGKSHLLQYIKAVAEFYGSSVKIVSNEKFVSEIMQCIQERQSTRTVLNRYRKYDILAIENIEYLREKESTQEEVFRLAKDFLCEGKKKILFTCSKESMKGLEVLEERLHTSLQTLVYNLAPPDYGQRLSYIRSALKEKNIDLPKDIMMKMAEEENMRILNGMITNVIFRVKYIQKTEGKILRRSSEADCIREFLSTIYGVEGSDGRWYSKKRDVLQRLTILLRDIGFLLT